MQRLEGAHPQPAVRGFGAAGEAIECRIELDAAGDDDVKLAAWARRWRMAIRKTLPGGEPYDGGKGIGELGKKK